MDILTLNHIALQYYGTDWIVMVTGLAGTYLLGNKRRTGFLLGMASAAFGILFSMQIGSVANGITSVTFLLLFLRGYLRWGS